MSPAPNLRFIKKLPAQWKAPTLNLNVPGPLDMRRKIVLKAMYKNYDPTFVEEVKAQRRSDSSNEALIDDFMKTEQPEVHVNKDSHYLRALKVMTAAFKPKVLYKPVSFPDLRYYPWRQNVSAEVPYARNPKWIASLAKKFRDGEIDNASTTFRNLFDEIFWINRTLVHKIKDGSSTFFESDGTPRPYYWVNLHARAHVVGPDDDDKIRAVFGVPKLLLMVENMFIWPMQADLLNRDSKHSPLLWGCEIMRGGWKRIRNLVDIKTRGKFNSVLCADWSQFDRRALFSIIDDVHSIWKTFYDMSGTYQPTNFYPNASTDSERFENLWNWFTHNVKHYPIALPNGKVYQWTRNGIASGYQETQILDSWVNGIMLLTVLSKLGVNIEAPHFFFKLQGDDSICCFAEPFLRLYGRERFLSMIEKEAALRFNAKLSAEKTYLTENLDGAHVLGYGNTSGIAFRTDLDLLTHLLFPERPQSLEATAGSAMGIAIAAMGCSHQVYDTCRDVFDFITKELGRTYHLTAHDERKLTYLYGGEFRNEILSLQSQYETIRFPSYLSTWLQNFILVSRDESDRNRSWPTDPSRTGGFCFI